MAVDTASDILAFKKQGTGNNLNTWGDELNNALDRISEAIADRTEKSLTGNYTLTSTNYVQNESRSAALVFSDGGLSATPTVTLPARKKLYWAKNTGSTYGVTLGVSGGTSVTIPTGGRWVFVLCDGTDCEIHDPSVSDLKAPTAALSMNSQKITSLADPTDAQDAATKAYTDSTLSPAVDAAAASAAAAATSATNAATSATNAAASATAAATSATNAGTSETNAASSATAASTSATNAGTSETNAGNSATAAATSATNAASSATAASSSATNAATSATNAASSATAASSSATNAATAETNAETAETNAETALSSFYDWWIGAAGSDPVNDLNGDPVSEGQGYWNSTSKAAKIHNGSAFESISVATSAGAVSYDNTSSGLTATTAQAAIDELENEIDGSVPTSRTVSAGTGLTGGGNLSANRTISPDIASQGEAEAGSSSTKLMTPQRVAQAISALSSGGFTLISSDNISASSSAVVISSGIGATYDEYEIHLHNIDLSNSTQLEMYVSANGGTSWATSSYRYAIMYIDQSGQHNYFNNANAGFFNITGANNYSSGVHLSGIIRLITPATSKEQALMWDVIHQDSSGNVTRSSGAGSRNATEVIDAVRFLPSSGTFDGGSVKLYGVKKS